MTIRGCQVKVIVRMEIMEIVYIANINLSDFACLNSRLQHVLLRFSGFQSRGIDSIVCHCRICREQQMAHRVYYTIDDSFIVEVEAWPRGYTLIGCGLTFCILYAFILLYGDKSPTAVLAFP